MSHQIDAVNDALDRMRDLAAENVRLRALNDELVRALKLALYMLFPYEPEDSRAVSEEFVALAAVSCGIGDEKTSAVIAAALARAGEQK